MYLISLYFDETSTYLLQQYVISIEQKTNNHFLSNHNIPLHLTLATFHDENVDKIIDSIQKQMYLYKQGPIDIVSIGSFSKNTLYLTSLYNQYLHEFSKNINSIIQLYDRDRKNNRYQPFHWLPHITIARKLNEKEMIYAFETINKLFQPLQVKIVKMAISSSRPYRDIYIWNLKE